MLSGYLIAPDSTPSIRNSYLIAILRESVSVRRADPWGAVEHGGGVVMGAVIEGRELLRVWVACGSASESTGNVKRNGKSLAVLRRDDVSSLYACT